MRGYTYYKSQLYQLTYTFPKEILSRLQCPESAIGSTRVEALWKQLLIHVYDFYSEPLAVCEKGGYITQYLHLASRCVQIYLLPARIRLTAEIQPSQPEIDLLLNKMWELGQEALPLESVALLACELTKAYKGLRKRRKQIFFSRESLRKVLHLLVRRPATSDGGVNETAILFTKEQRDFIISTLNVIYDTLFRAPDHIASMNHPLLFVCYDFHYMDRVPTELEKARIDLDWTR